MKIKQDAISSCDDVTVNFFDKKGVCRTNPSLPLHGKH